LLSWRAINNFTNYVNKTASTVIDSPLAS